MLVRASSFHIGFAKSQESSIPMRSIVFSPAGINNTTVKLVDKSVVKDVGNLFAKGKRAEKSGTGLISYSIDIQIVINMIKNMLKLNPQRLKENSIKISMQ